MANSPNLEPMLPLTTEPAEEQEALKPWQQQPNETRKAFEAFAAYRDMDTGRSYTAVSLALHKSRTLIKRWASKYHWQDRLRAWLTQADAERERAARIELREMAGRDRDVAAIIVRKCVEAVSFLNPRDITPADLHRLLDIAIRMERTSYGLDGSLHLTSIEQLAVERPEGDVISESIKALSPIDRDLLRTISLKRLRIVQLKAMLASRGEVSPPPTENPNGSDAE